MTTPRFSIACAVLAYILSCSLVNADRVCEKLESPDKYHPHAPTNCREEKRSAFIDKEDGERGMDTLITELNDEDYHPDHRRTDKAARSRSQYVAKNADEEKTKAYWDEISESILKVALENENMNTNVAKNTIIFLGDGMGVQSITSARILKGQMEGYSGEETKLVMETFPHVGLSKTYNVDHQVPDSAGTATAYLTGVKTRYGVIGLNAGAEYGNCSSAEGKEVRSVLKDAKAEGKSTGIVTTTRLNHATPSGSYAHSPYRYWYGDADLSQEAKDNHCKDIAQQLYDNLPLIDVALGGGRRYFRPKTVPDEEYPSQYYVREDGQDLIEKWKVTMEDSGEKAEFVWNKDQFDNVDPETTDRIWGMFERSDMQFEVDRDKNMEPSLAEMTRKAIQFLQKNEKGFYLLVEGGRIDHAHHDTNAYRALHETVAFDEAIEVARSMTSESDTLIVVTADHSHTFTLGGYADRGNSIFGLAPHNDDPEIALDMKKYTSLAYGNGEGYQGEGSGVGRFGGRQDVTEEMAADKDYLQQTAVPLSSETHGGDDVVIMASGPMSHLFHGVHEQNYIAHVMRYASCVGENKEHCEENTGTDEADKVEFLGYNLSKNDAEAALYSLFALEIVFTLSAFGLLGTLVRKRKLF